MTVKELISALELDLKAGETGQDRTISGGYVSDLMSDVLANAREGNIWVTLQIHANVVAVASVRDLAGIIVINGREPEEGTLAKAGAEGLPLMVSKLSAFELVGRLHALGISGSGI